MFVWLILVNSFFDGLNMHMSIEQAFTHFMLSQLTYTSANLTIACQYKFKKSAFLRPYNTQIYVRHWSSKRSNKTLIIISESKEEKSHKDVKFDLTRCNVVVIKTEKEFVKERQREREKRETRKKRKKRRERYFIKRGIKLVYDYKL